MTDCRQVGPARRGAGSASINTQLDSEVRARIVFSSATPPRPKRAAPRSARAPAPPAAPTVTSRHLSRMVRRHLDEVISPLMVPSDGPSDALTRLGKSEDDIQAYTYFAALRTLPIRTATILQ